MFFPKYLIIRSEVWSWQTKSLQSNLEAQGDKEVVKKGNCDILVADILLELKEKLYSKKKLQNSQKNPSPHKKINKK